MGWRRLFVAVGWLTATTLAAVTSAATPPQQRPQPPTQVRVVGVHPVIFNVIASGVTTAGATITWSTDEPSDSQVEYGTTQAFGSMTPLNTSAVTSHSATLAGLTSNTLYHFRVYSRDPAGNLAISARYTLNTASPSGPSIVLAPQDTSLNLNTTNYSTAPTLTTYTWPNQKVANVIVMKFDLSALAGATVHEATLTLGLVESDTTADPTYAVSAHKIVGRNPVITAATGYTADGTAAWTANSCCSNGVPMAQANISVPYHTRAIDKTSGLKSWTITSMVQEWLADPSTNFGVLMNSDATKASDRYRYFASIEHADSTLRPSLRISYTAGSPPPPDTVLPTVSMTAPVAGATVSGTVAVTASASDNVGVTSVQFQLNGANLGSADTSAPYSTNWDTTSAQNGSHTLRAIARDAAGNQRTSTSITVTVSNVTPPPPSNPWTNEPSGFTVIEETGWEAGTLGNWYKIFTSADKPISVGTITGSLLGESRALQIDFPQGHVGGGGTELRFDIPSASRSNEVYIGFYVQVNSQWQGHNSGINKMLYLHDGGASFSAMWYEMFGTGSSPLDLYVVNQSGSGPAGFHENVNEVTFARGQWHKVEIYQKQGDANNGIVRVWVNGVLAIDRSDVDTRSTPIDNVTISGIWGGVGDSKNQADYMRFDRIRISRR